MNKQLLSAAAMLSSCLAFVGSAHAASPATSTLDVSATITSDCTVGTTAVSFGAVASGSGANATGSVDVTCTLSTPYTIALDRGGSYDGVSTRQITDGTNFLAYALNDAATITPWGDGGVTIAGNTVNGTGTGAQNSHGINASLTGGNVPAGTYTDTVNVTVTY